MFTQKLTTQMLRLVDEFKRRRQQKNAASANKARAIDCMELEDRTLLSAAPMAAEALVNAAGNAAAQQTTDWGAPLGPSQSLAIRIFQLSALIGRGAGRSVTLTF